MDVAVNPNEPAGIWLRHYLEAKGVPYYAFLRAIPGKATGAHIHIGPGSTAAAQRRLTLSWQLVPHVFLTAEQIREPRA